MTAPREKIRPTRLNAAVVSAALSLLFIVVYGACNWITSRRTNVGTWFYGWERYIPFIPWMIVPYMSIDAFFVAAPFVCATTQELRIFARRVAFSIAVAGVFFVAMPLQYGVAVSDPSGWTGPIFKFLHGFDRPTNLFPSLHIALRTILARVYARHTKGAVRAMSNVWFSLIGFSTVLTWQHHVVDVVGGFFLAGVAIYLFREETVKREVAPNRRVGLYYIAGAVAATALAAVSWPWTGVLLLPAASMLGVGLGYFGLGPAVYRKTNGEVPWSARLLLAPCLLGQHISLVYYRRQCRAWDRVTPKVWIGVKPTSADAVELVRRGATSVLDLTAEFKEPAALREVAYKNIPILDLTRPTDNQLREAVEFIARQAQGGIVYIHCKAGYSRTAAVVGAYLIEAGLANSVEEAVALLRAVRPRIVIRPEAMQAMRDFAAKNLRPAITGVVTSKAEACLNGR